MFHLRRFVIVSVMTFLGCQSNTSQSEPVAPTFRIISGVSMGAIGATSLGLKHPEKFDAVAALGGPLDAAIFFRGLQEFYLGGFCPLADLEALASKDPVLLNDSREIAKCAQRAKTLAYERSQDFNHWAFSLSGGTISRDTYLNMFNDLTVAHGGFIYENPESTFAPSGVPVEFVQHPSPDFCQQPYVVKKLFNAEYNPIGKYDAITFCDGQPTLFFCRNNQEPVDFCSDDKNIAQPLDPSQERVFAENYCRGKGGAEEANPKEHGLFFMTYGGQVDPCRQAPKPMRVALAFDLNGNRRRDYGEPIVVNAQERFDDVGVDGCPDERENGVGGCWPNATATGGDLNQDNYDVDRRPFGTERNFLYEQGEPFRDFGVDGVSGTSDFGEGNGRFDLSRGRQSLLEYDARRRLQQLDANTRGRLAIYLDGGVRDVFNLGLTSQHVFSSVKALFPQATLYRDFVDIPGMKSERNGLFDPWNARWKSVPRNLFVLYGKDAPSDDERVRGEGDHVGTTDQAASRFYTLFNWGAATWPKLDRPPSVAGGGTQEVTWFYSKALRAKWEFGISLPPGYAAAENEDTRYPVHYMLHGYGMEPKGLMATTLVPDAYVVDSQVKFRPMITIFPSGRCCFRHKQTKERDCRTMNDAGLKLETLPDFEKECHSGTFFINSAGYSEDSRAALGDAFLELIDYIDTHYRTLSKG